MASKRYFWFKLKENFYGTNIILELSKSVFGCMVIVCYQKLILKALNTGGVLRACDYQMLDIATIAALTDVSIPRARRVMTRLARVGLVIRLDDGSILLPGVEQLVDSETNAAVRKREQRARHCPQEDGNCPTDIDTDTHTDREREVNKDALKDALPPPLASVNEYAWELGIPGEAQAFMDFYTARSWCIDGTPMADWRAAMRMWASRIGRFGKNSNAPAANWDDGSDIRS